MVDLWRDFWIRETGTGQQVAQLHDSYMMMMMPRSLKVSRQFPHRSFAGNMPKEISIFFPKISRDITCDKNGIIQKLILKTVVILRDNFCAGVKGPTAGKYSFVYAPPRLFNQNPYRWIDHIYECIRSWRNIFEMGITFPGRCDVNQAATRPCRLQLGTVLGSSANKESSSYYIVYGDTF